MAYPYTNAMNIDGELVGNTPTVGAGISAGNFPMFQTSSPVDASGLEMAFVADLDNGTAGTQTIGSGASTVIIKPYDAATTAAGATTATPIFAATVFSNGNSGANSWTGAHTPMKGTGSTTKDLDADDWVNLEVGANITGTGGFGALKWAAFFVHGVPGAVA